LQAELWQQLTAAERERLARALGERADVSEPRQRAFLALARAEREAAEQAFASAAEQALRAGDPAAAEALLREADGLLPAPSAALGSLRGEALRALGRSREALRVLAAVSGEAVQLLRAEILRLSGAAAAALAQAEELVAAPASAASVRAASHAVLG